MNAAHTPGPWTYSPPDDQVQDLFTEECFFIEGPGSDVHGHMTLADARLIAAAPELLDALVNLLANQDAACAASDFTSGQIKAMPYLKAARVAIAKAGGEA